MSSFLYSFLTLTSQSVGCSRPGEAVLSPRQTDRQTERQTVTLPHPCTMLLASALFSLPCAVWDEASEILLISACFSCNCLQVMLVLVFETCRSPLFFISIYFSNQLKVSFFCFCFLLLNIGTMCYSNHEMLFYSEIKLVTEWNALESIRSYSR
jgi:hypothetical protein